VTRDLGANEFTFAGDRTAITYFPVAPGPVVVGQEGGLLQYQGVEGSHSFRGHDISLADTQLGTLVSVVLEANPDRGTVTATVVVPHVTGVTRESPVVFETMALKTTGRGFIATPGADRTYTILPMLATAKQVVLPL